MKHEISVQFEKCYNKTHLGHDFTKLQKFFLYIMKVKTLKN